MNAPTDEQLGDLPEPDSGLGIHRWSYSRAAVRAIQRDTWTRAVQWTEARFYGSDPRRSSAQPPAASAPPTVTIAQGRNAGTYNLLDSRFWNFHSDPAEEGWHPALVCYGEREGSFPSAAYWNGNAWEAKAVVAFGPHAADRAAATASAYEHDPDMPRRAALARAPADKSDAERLNFVYGRSKTTSDALLRLEVRILNEDWPTPEEVRAAIDDAMLHATPTTEPTK